MDVFVAGATGTFGGWATRLPGIQAPLSMMIVNSGTSAANTALDNWMYGENNSVYGSAISNGIGTAVGYRLAIGLDGKINPVFNGYISATASDTMMRILGDGSFGSQKEKDKGVQGK